MMDFIQNLWAVLLELSPWLLVGATVSGLIHVMLPHDFVGRHLSGRGSIIKAVALGVPLPLCSCGVIPAGLGLKRDGASDAAAVGFLISTPQTGVDSILVSAAFLGWPFALFKVGAATITGLMGGWLTEHLGGERKPFSSEGTEHSDPTQRGWRDAIDHGEDLIRTIWGWLLFGVVISAAISTWVSTDGLMSLSEWGPVLTMLLMLVISLPLYVCATASVPIAASLVAGGMPTGAALVFLMAGPATNVATIGAIHRAFGGRILGLYLGTIISGSLGLGLLYDAWLPTTVTAVAGHGDHMSWWAVGSAALLVVLIGKYAISDGLSWLNMRRAANHTSEGRVTLAVQGMTCGGCVARLERELKAADGVSLVAVSLEPGQAIVEGTLNQAQVAALIDATGFKAVV
ncbi:MAG: permease [Deltaproteobacteria bacterium]|nr:permease [Deltaproteobacteria bacterium]